MELLVLLAIGAVWYYFSNNKQVNREVTKERIVQKFKTEDGYVERETTRTYEADIVDFKKTDFVNQPTPPNSNQARNTTSEIRRERVINEPREQPVTIEYNQPTKQYNLTPIVERQSRQMMVTQDNSAQMKRCPHCNRLQPLSEYKPNKNQPDGLTKWCSACMAPKKENKGLRKCPKCKQMRRLESYGHSPTNPDGLHKWCKFCHRH